MSECVVRMKIPKEGCHTCDARCVSDLYGYICGIERKNVMPFLGKKNRPDWCPIVRALPENHGRLVDADAVESIIRKWFEEIKLNPDILLDGVKSLPTIVPAPERREE